MAGDNLFAILGMMRAEMPEIPDETWEKIKRGLSVAASGERVYVPAYKKRTHLEAIAAAGDEASAQQLSKLLGLSVRQSRRLRRLR